MQWLTHRRLLRTTCSIRRSARIAAAIGPYLHGARDHRRTGASTTKARAILGTGAHYVDTLASARHGSSSSFFLLALVVWLWARRIVGDVGAAIATLLRRDESQLARARRPRDDGHRVRRDDDARALRCACWWIETPTLGTIARRFGAGDRLWRSAAACRRSRSSADRWSCATRCARGRDTREWSDLSDDA